MSTHIQDIDTAAAPEAAPITDLIGLTQTVARMASLQLILNGAEAQLQARVEAAKAAFATATQEHAEEIRTLFAAVERYCEQHKDELFPVKGGKRRKTFAILQHALQYRSSVSVEVPPGIDAVGLIRNEISQLEREVNEAYQHTGETPPAERVRLLELINALQAMIRQPAPEVNKEAVAAAWVPFAADILRATGIRLVERETFKLAFKFTPDRATA